jgi:hypothetical protein
VQLLKALLILHVHLPRALLRSIISPLTKRPSQYYASGYALVLVSFANGLMMYFDADRSLVAANDLKFREIKLLEMGFQIFK